MIVFADSSWWVPFKCRRDLRHARAVGLFDQLADCDLLWTPWHRVEVFNTIRQITRFEPGLLSVAEARQTIRHLEQEVRLGYYLHFEFDWRDAVRNANKISDEIGFTQRVRSMDLFHVAVALEADVDVFVSFDEDQLNAAEAAGLRVFNPSSGRKMK